MVSKKTRSFAGILATGAQLTTLASPAALAVTAAVLTALVVAAAPCRADGFSVWLYGSGGAYLASGYDVIGTGHVLDPLGHDVGTVDQASNIHDSNGNLIGYVVAGS